MDFKVASFIYHCERQGMHLTEKQAYALIDQLEEQMSGDLESPEDYEPDVLRKGGSTKGAGNNRKRRRRPRKSHLRTNEEGPHPLTRLHNVHDDNVRNNTSHVPLLRNYNLYPGD